MLPQENVNKGEALASGQEHIRERYTVDADLLAWYKQPSEPIEGQAYVTISADENPMKAIRSDHFDSGVGWDYTIYLKEENGIDFTVDTYSVVMFYTDTRAYIDKFNAEAIKSWWGDNVISGWGRQSSSGNFPRQEMLGIGILISGVDAKGQCH